MLLVSGFLHLAAIFFVKWIAQPQPNHPERVMVTKLVRLGAPRPKELLPRRAAPPPPPAAVALTPSPKKTPAPPPKPIPKAKPPPRPPTAQQRLQQMQQVQHALDRLKSRDKAAGDPEGTPGGETSEALEQIATTRFGTEVYRCMKANYAVEGIDPRVVKGRSATVLIRVRADGQIIDYKLTKSSGLAIFDAAVAHAVKRCGRVPPPGAAIRERMQREGIVLDFVD